MGDSVTGLGLALVHITDLANAGLTLAYTQQGATGQLVLGGGGSGGGTTLTLQGSFNQALFNHTTDGAGGVFIGYSSSCLEMQ